MIVLADRGVRDDRHGRALVHDSRTGDGGGFNVIIVTEWSVQYDMGDGVAVV